jgi:hypothetical protein
MTGIKLLASMCSYHLQRKRPIRVVFTLAVAKDGALTVFPDVTALITKLPCSSREIIELRSTPNPPLALGSTVGVDAAAGNDVGAGDCVTPDAVVETAFAFRL